MEKPESETISYYNYHAVIDYIEKKHKINTNDYAGKFKNFDPNNDTIPYLNFWHWITDIRSIHNGAIFDLDILYLIEFEHTPKFCKEILELIYKEYNLQEMTFRVDW